jgi:hypothetical protein
VTLPNGTEEQERQQTHELDEMQSAGSTARRHSISPTFDLFVPLAFGFGVGIKWTTGAPESLTLFPSSLFSEGARPHLLGRTECQWKIVAVKLKEY